jgi:hypothetical protein
MELVLYQHIRTLNLSLCSPGYFTVMDIPVHIPDLVASEDPATDDDTETSSTSVPSQRRVDMRDSLSAESSADDINVDDDCPELVDSEDSDTDDDTETPSTPKVSVPSQRRVDMRDSSSAESSAEDINVDDDCPELVDSEDSDTDTEEFSASESSDDDRDNQQSPSTPPKSKASPRRMDMLSTLLAQHTYRAVVELLHLQLHGCHGQLSSGDAGKVLRKYARGECRSARRCAAIEAALGLWTTSLDDGSPPVPAPVPASPSRDDEKPPANPIQADPGLRLNELVHSAEKRGSRVICPDCRRSLASRSSFRRHYQSCHAQEFRHHQRTGGIWPCGSCGLPSILIV